MNFANVSRNRFLKNAGLTQPQPMSTGTTICGVIFDGGLVLGADTRATAGKLSYLSNKITISPILQKYKINLLFYVIINIINVNAFPFTRSNCC